MTVETKHIIEAAKKRRADLTKELEQLDRMIAAAEGSAPTLPVVPVYVPSPDPPLDIRWRTTCAPNPWPSMQCWTGVVEPFPAGAF